MIVFAVSVVSSANGSAELVDLSAGLVAAGADGACGHEACDPATVVTRDRATTYRAAAAMHGAKRSNIRFSLSPVIRAAGCPAVAAFLILSPHRDSNTEVRAVPNFATAGIGCNRILALGP